MCTQKYLKSFLLIIVLSFITIGSSSAQHDEHKHQQKKELVRQDSSIVREGTIDLKKIDENKDGKVYQDQMDWNVISDKPGKCPLCKMILKEVSLKVAKDNLVKNGFTVK